MLPKDLLNITFFLLLAVGLASAQAQNTNPHFKKLTIVKQWPHLPSNTGAIHYVELNLLVSGVLTWCIAAEPFEGEKECYQPLNEDGDTIDTFFMRIKGVPGGGHLLTLEFNLGYRSDRPAQRLTTTLPLLCPEFDGFFPEKICKITGWKNAVFSDLGG